MRSFEKNGCLTLTRANGVVASSSPGVGRLKAYRLQTMFNGARPKSEEVIKAYNKLLGALQP